MSEADRDKWQHMYTSGRYRARSEPGELLQAFPTLRVIEYREQLITEADGMRMVVARLAACDGEAGL